MFELLAPTAPAQYHNGDADPAPRAAGGGQRLNLDSDAAFREHLAKQQKGSK